MRAVVYVLMCIMQWSRLKTAVKDFICPELKDRIDFYLTSYREAHDGADRVWITVDGEKIFSCEHYRHERAEADAYHAGRSEGQVKALLTKNEIHSPKNFGDAMRVYLDSPIQESLESPDPLVKAFAIVDRRVGRRSLAKLEISASEHSLVKRFYELRHACARI